MAADKSGVEELTDCDVNDATWVAKRPIASSVISGTSNRSIAGRPSASIHTSPGRFTQISMTSVSCRNRRIGLAACRKYTGRVSHREGAGSSRLTGVAQFIQSLFHRVRIKIGEIEIALHKDDNARALIDVDCRRDADVIAERHFGHPGDALRHALRRD